MKANFLYESLPELTEEQFNEHPVCLDLSGCFYEKKLSYYGEVELALKEHLGRKIKVNGNEKKGVLEIEFYGKDDLTYIAKLLGQEEK